MLIIKKNISKLNFQQLMSVYAESNALKGKKLYGELPEQQQIISAENEFYDYLLDFFTDNLSFYGILEIEGTYVSALRVESYRDGLLLEGLETKPDMRGRGYAQKLIGLVLSHIDSCEKMPVYSHIRKNNAASLKAHLACGFHKIKDCAALIDGSVSYDYYTLCYYSDIKIPIV